jgi:hypothetical protein
MMVAVVNARHMGSMLGRCQQQVPYRVTDFSSLNAAF